MPIVNKYMCLGALVALGEVLLIALFLDGFHLQLSAGTPTLVLGHPTSTYP